MDIKEKIGLLKRATTEPDGMKKLGAAMVDVIKLMMPVEGIARQVLAEDPLGAGQIAYYDADVEVPAVILSLHGASVVRELTPARVFAPPVRIDAFPTLDKADLRLARYNALDRAREVGTNEIIKKEDAYLFDLLDAAITAYATDPAHTVTPDHIIETYMVSQPVLGEAIATVASHQLEAKTIILNPVEYQDILGWGVNFLGYKAIDTIVDTGKLPFYGGCALLVRSHCPVGKVYVLPGPEYIGYLPTYLDLTPDPYEDVPNHRTGWNLWELISMAIMNPRGLVRIDVTRTVPTLYTVGFATDPTTHGTIKFNGINYSNGNSVDVPVGTYSLVGTPGTGYNFTQWQVTGGVSVANANSATTNCTVTADGTLKMVQTVI